jgi:hypothetical protein
MAVDGWRLRPTESAIIELLVYYHESRESDLSN